MVHFYPSIGVNSTHTPLGVLCTPQKPMYETFYRAGKRYYMLVQRHAAIKTTEPARHGKILRHHRQDGNAVVGGIGNLAC